MSVEQWVQQRLGGYVRMNVEDRREAVRELAGEGLSNVAIGEVLGVDEKLVRLDKRSENSEQVVNEPNTTAPEAVATSEISENSPTVQNPSSIGDKRKAGENARKAILEAPVDPEILPGVYAEDFFTGADRAKTNKYAEQLVRHVRETGRLIGKLPRKRGKRTDIEPAETDFGKFLRTSGMEERSV